MQKLVVLPGTEVYWFVFPANKSNMYAILGDGEALLIDVFASDELEALLAERGIRRLTVILTHGHWDHASGAAWARSCYDCRLLAGAAEVELLRDPRKNLSRHFEVLLHMHSAAGTTDAPPDFRVEPFSLEPDGLLEDAEHFLWQGHRFEVRRTPGHTEGSVCVLADGECLFSGDSLVNGYPTLTRWPTGSQRRFEDVTVPFFDSLPDELTVLPGHGAPGRLGDLRRYLSCV